MAKSISKIDPFLAREARKYAKPIPSREFIMQYLKELGCSVNHKDLITVFKLRKAEAREALLRRLKAMVRDGQLLINRKGNYALVKKLALVSGHVVCHKDGYGFLIPDDNSNDIFLNFRQVRSLFPGDRVLVSVSRERGRSEGNVVEILERNFQQIVGRYVVARGMAFIIPANKNIAQDIIIPKGREANAKQGQIVVGEIISYPTKRNSATAKIVEVLGEYMAPGMEINIAIRAHGIPYAWSDEVLQECEAITTVIPKREKNKRQALQHFPFVTIDGEDAKDFDDAVYCQRRAKGDWMLYVAIADVSHYVRFAAALDQEASIRGNSVYFPGCVVPMLPEVLSNEVCSLRPKVERLAMVCEMVVSKVGKIVRYKFYDAVIKSHARLTYAGVFALLEKKKSSVLLPHLQELKNLCDVLLQQRKNRGALDFARIESEIVFAKDRTIERIEAKQSNYVHGMIEECMLAANVCASLYLSQAKIPALYRVHEGPDANKLTELRRFLGGLGLSLGGGKKPKPIHYAKLLQKIVGRRDEHLVQTVLLRSMRQANYTPKNIGHFGLAYEVYAHFTSPIRRYADLLNHRAIRYLLHGGKIKGYSYTQDMMQDFADHVSITERRAEDATRDAIAWLKCEFMQDKIGQPFVGIISGVTNFGVFVELKDIFVEGLVHITALVDDYYDFDALHHRLVGEYSGKVYRLGDPIKVIVARVNLDDRTVDFTLER